MKPRTPPLVRLMALINHDDSSPCWQWAGGTNGHGYGSLWMPAERNRGRCVGAHRVAYELFVGPIPDGMTIDHLCRNRACVNPAHLEPVTNADNIRRGESVPARNGRKTHCIHGHEFTPENTRIRTRGRECKTCARRLKIEQLAREKAARHARGLIGYPRRTANV